MARAAQWALPRAKCLSLGNTGSHLSEYVKHLGKSAKFCLMPVLACPRVRTC